MTDETKKRLVFAMPPEFGDGVTRVIWDPVDRLPYWGDIEDYGLYEGDKLEIEVLAMTQAEIDALPEV